MRAITGSIVSSERCPLLEAQHMLRRMCRSADTYLTSSDCLTYIHALDEAIREQIKFVRRLGRQHGAAGHDARGYERPVEGEGERWGGENNRDMVVHLGEPHGSVEEAKVAVAADEKKSKKRKKVDDTHEDKAAGVPSHAPASPEILFEQRRKKEKHPSRELFSVVKQEPDLVVEEDVGTERKKKKEKHSDTQLAIVVKQEPGLVVEEELGSEKKSTKKKEMARVKLEEHMVEMKGQIVSNVVAEQGGVADGEKRRKKKKHSEEEGNSKGVKQEEKMAADSDLDSEKKKKKKKKRGRGDNDDNIQEQGEHKKKKQRKESRE
ncbi:hypothetical protein QOZ80_1AG0003300 [Eleusine coracana subsp. coracana]|nr:hypothetical protein QOZ80_1AG0003300 [Eleusine coracana subsp. coracana]